MIRRLGLLAAVFLTVLVVSILQEGPHLLESEGLAVGLGLGNLGPDDRTEHGIALVEIVVKVNDSVMALSLDSNYFIQLS